MTIIEPSSLLSTTESHTGPYKFLDYYVEADRPRFSGRERDIKEVVERLMTDRACVLYGRSGLGKTSLVLAGVFPELRPRGFVPVHARVLESPLSDACKAVADAVGLTTYECSEEFLPALGLLSPTPRIVLALDQFEEFFIRFGRRPIERKAFSSWLAAMTSSKDVDFRVLISLREEYLSRLDEFTSDLPEMFSNEYRLRPLSAFGARQAIIRPLTVAGVDYDQKLINKIVDMLAIEDFDSLLLQIVCTAIYREACNRSKECIRLEECDLQNIGGIEGILRRYLDDVTARIPPEDVLLCRTILDALITPEGTKRAVTLQTLLNAEFTATEEEIKVLLKFLEDSRLVREELRSGQMWYELTHERLVRHIVDWFKLDRTFADFRAARELIASACRGDRGERFRERLDTLLARGHIEGVIRPFRERLRLDPVQLEFVFWSAVYQMVPDVDFWAKTWGYENSSRVLINLSEREDETARKAAMYAVTVIPAPNRELIRLCLKLVITDPSSEVRRAAGKSLAKIAEPQDIAELARIARVRRTRNAAREALADICEAGRQLDGVPFLEKRRARRIVRARRYKLHAETIRERGKTGALSGVLAGSFWICTVGFMLTLAVSWLTGGIPIYGRFLPASSDLEVLILAIPAGLVFAAFAGWKSCKRMARRVAYADQDKQFYRLGTTRTVFWCFVLAVGLAGMAGLHRPREFQEYATFAIFPGLLALLILTVAGQIAVARSSFWPGVPQREVFFWALLQSIGLPLLATGALTLQLARSQRFITWTTSNTRTGIWLSGISFGILLSFSTFVLIISLSRAAARHTIGKVPAFAPRRRSFARRLVVLSAIGFIVWFGANFLPASAPFLATRIVGSSSSSSAEHPQTKSELHVTWPNSRFMSFHVDEPQQQWYQVIDVLPRDTSLNLSGGSVTLPEPLADTRTRDLVLYVPIVDTGGDQLAALSTNSPSTPGEDRTLKLDPVLAFDGSSPLVMANKEELRQITFQQSDSNQELWFAVLVGSFAREIDASGKVLRLSVLEPVEEVQTEKPTEAKMNAQLVGKPACSISSIASFSLPQSLAMLVFHPSDSEVGKSYQTTLHPSSHSEKFLEIPIGPDNSFSAHLLLLPPNQASAVKPSKSAVPAASAIGSLEKKGTEPTKLSPRRMTLTVALELAPFLDRQKGTLDLIYQNRYQEAIASARKTLQEYPDDNCSQNNLAWALVKSHQYQEAIFAATVAVNSDPRSPEYQDTLAHAAYGSKQWDKAVEAWERAIALDPDFLADRTDPECKNDGKLLMNARHFASAQAATNRPLRQ